MIQITRPFEVARQSWNRINRMLAQRKSTSKNLIFMTILEIEVDRDQNENRTYSCLPARDGHKNPNNHTKDNADCKGATIFTS